MRALQSFATPFFMFFLNHQKEPKNGPQTGGIWPEG
jgi:hypothetical protein